MQGRIVKGIGGFYFVSDGSRVVMGKARGNLKRNKELLYVGDIVDYEITADGEAIINGVARRDNSLIRPPVSNLNLLVVVFAASSPEPNFNVIDKMCIACEAKGIDIAICITKPDLVSSEELDEIRSRYDSAYDVMTVNGMTGAGIDSLRERISGRNVALAGPSGVGKSTILNNIVGAQSAETGTVSDKTGRGRHTTRHVEIFELGDGTNLYDTPGFTSLELPSMEPSELSNLIPEFRACRGQCRYADCVHMKEPGCAVKEAVNEGVIPEGRYDTYLNLMEEVKKWRK
ncbi:MAG: ribosome small subunit-dependent GTPase A [Firmicutes bacterium]|nr:ribosome small subunit-dependent GTPase A [Bacillota bacterium]